MEQPSYRPSFLKVKKQNLLLNLVRIIFQVCLIFIKFLDIMDNSSSSEQNSPIITERPDSPVSVGRPNSPMNVTRPNSPVNAEVEAPETQDLQWYGRLNREAMFAVMNSGIAPLESGRIEYGLSRPSGRDAMENITAEANLTSHYINNVPRRDVATANLPGTENNALVSNINDFLKTVFC